MTKLSNNVIEQLDMIKFETGEDKFVFALREELNKVGIVDNDVEILYMLLDNGIDELVEKVYKKYVGDFLNG